MGTSGGVGQGGSAGALPAQGAVTLQFGSTPSSTCPEPAKTDLVGNPAPSANDPGNSVIDGQNGASISCSVRGSGPFTFSGSLHANDNENNPIAVSFTDGQVGTDKTNGTVTLNVFTSQLGPAFTSAPGACTVTVINRQIKPGSIWATFACPSITSAPVGQCQIGSTSTIVFENCDGS